MALNKTMTFDLELKPGGIPPIIHASQGDIGRMFKANIYWDGSAATSYVSGATVNLRGKKPDKTVFDYTATLAGSMVTFETTEQMTIISGPVECELVFSNDGDVIASANFVLMVEESPYNPDALSESDVEGLADVLEGFQRLNRDSNGVVKIGDGVTASGTAEPIKGFYVHDEETNTDGVAKVSIEAVQEFEDDIRDETANWLDEHPDATTTVLPDSLTTDKYKDGSVTLAKINTDVLQYISPFKFGAVGDGVTDDSVAVETAGHYGTVREPNGTFYIGRSIDLPHGTKDTKFFVEINSTITTQSDISGCEFYKDLSQASTTNRGQWLVVARNKRGITLENNKFHDCVSALYVDRCLNAKISKNSFYDIPQTAAAVGGNGYGVCIIASHNSIISNNTFLNVARHSIYLSKDTEPSKGNENIVVSDNIFKWDENKTGDDTGFEATIMCRSTKNLHIVNNAFYGLKGICTLMTQDDGDGNFDYCLNTYVSGNDCIDMSNSTRRSDGIVKTTSDANAPEGAVDGIFVFDNNVYSTTVSFMDIDVGTNIVVNGNYFNGSTDYARFIRGDSGSGAIKNISIANNKVVVGNGTVCFQFTGAIDFEDFVISNNDIDCGYLMGLDSNCTFEKWVFKDNFIKSANKDSYTSSPTVKLLVISGNIATKKIMIRANTNSVNGVIVQRDNSIIVDVNTETSYMNRTVKDYLFPWGAPNDAELGGEMNFGKFVGNANLSSLPTANIKFGQVAVTTDGNAYVYTRNGWKQINNT